jgi:beta-lactamase superfamily II metal-dependent hydrolase
MTRRTFLIVGLGLGLLSLNVQAGQSDKRLDIYWVDTEGGAAVLVVTPTGESVLIDTGNPGERDSSRIIKAVREAGVEAIDHLVTTHYHIDHMGGASAVAKAVPIRNVYDNGDKNPAREKPTEDYLKMQVEKRIVVNPGDVIPLRQAEDGPRLELKVIGARKQFIEPPAGAAPNPLCGTVQGKAQDLTDNANSIVLLLSFGDFRFYDGGDLTWNVESRLVCPVNLVGEVDVYQVTHHGLDNSNNPLVVRSLKPTIAIMNNGTTKGAGPETMATLKSTDSIKAIYQSHKCLRPDAQNAPEAYIANLPEKCEGNPIRLSVDEGAKTYTVSIPANRHERTFEVKGKVK